MPPSTTHFGVAQPLSELVLVVVLFSVFVLGVPAILCINGFSLLHPIEIDKNQIKQLQIHVTLLHPCGLISPVSPLHLLDR